jgi:predicted nucleic acid-binding protein
LIVIDASVAISWLLDDESEFGAALEPLRDVQGVVPAIFPFEVCNAIQSATLRGRISPKDAVAATKMLYEFDIEVEAPPTADMAARILEMCQTHDVSAYDASYLELAARRSAPLATFDRTLRVAARDADVTIL